MSATTLENKYLGMSETPDIQVKRAQGDFVYDSRVKKYIDFVMGWCVWQIPNAPQRPIVDKGFPKRVPLR